MAQINYNLSPIGKDKDGKTIGIVEISGTGCPNSQILEGNKKSGRIPIDKFKSKKFRFRPLKYFGTGKSHSKFLNILKRSKIWRSKNQKQFIQLEMKKKL